ncbi:MAG: 16S rRNA (cytidine(1402)-2'-O)-methyltransferase [Eubacteriales bacterium]|jgi:16S rRNA (cytidine1402-2'-O)-methyltransferase|nr:16S rRNA (cytidine(1402)-2'-O)-methyltransferase [Eubacteriales bacterium]MDD4104981.1 16S rRNA (cytidine(1402)-2'-O)-methyltransferase [Eubacteriales bacterium]MDD4711073.1 16S rRNA (cytidine(1402)-2'-O)-methyltransferase [Eubacteriales bacterium]NLO15726.1 16S rRNA (cytidine(1402)-2'-O)-methyltransferase [Clostridiales bacterium]
MLYVVATPIGNLKDISLRAIEVLRKVPLIAAEDTRVTRKLLNHLGISTRCVSYHEHNEREKSVQIVDRMTADNIDAALVTDAGTPGVSDPGAFLVREAAQRGVIVIPIPGANAVAAILSISGFANQESTFFGFLPRAKKAREEKLRSMAGKAQTAVLYESPHRVIALMESITGVFPHAQAVVSCDLTKLHEKTLRGSAEDILVNLRDNEKTEKGEYCVALDVSPFVPAPEDSKVDVGLEARLLDQIVKGASMRSAMETIILGGEKKNAVYAASISLKRLLK